MISPLSSRPSADIARQQGLAHAIRRDMLEITSEKRIHASSDDPAGALATARIGARQADNAAYAGNLTIARSIAAAGDSALAAMQLSLDRAGELMLAARGDGTSPEARAATAMELRVLAQDLSDLAASRDPLGQPLFADEPLAIAIADGVAVAPRIAASSLSLDGATPAAILFAAADTLAADPPGDTGTALERVLAAGAHVTGLRSQAGAAAARIDRIDERRATDAIRLAEARADREGTDIATVLARLESRQLTLEAAQAVYARVTGTGLFDLLR